MSLSAEALNKLEGLDLQRVRTGLDFAPTVESRRPVLADLSADGMRGFRDWDLSGVLAGLNSLTFEAVHPELVLPPAPMPEAETGAVLPPDGRADELAGEDDLPEWLKPADFPATYSRPTIPREASLGEDIIVGEPSPATGAMTEPEWTAEGPEDRGAGEDSAVSSEEEEAEAATPPERERRWPRELSISAEGMKLALKNHLSTWLNRTKVSFLTELGVGTGVGFLANMAFTELVAKDPKMATILPLALTSMQVWGGGFTSLVEASALNVLAVRHKFEIAGRYARASSLAERIAVTKSADGLVDQSLLAFASVTKASRDILIRPATAGFTAGTWLYAALAGAGVFGADKMLINQTHAVSQPGTGVPHVVTDHEILRHEPDAYPSHSGGGQVGGVSPEDRGAGAIINPPVELPGSGQAGNLSGGGESGTLPPGDLFPQPGDAELAVQQAAEAAQIPAQTMARDLMAGTVWGHEAEFVRSLGVGHENVAANVLKNLDYGLKAAGQSFSRLNPEEVVNLVNRDVAAKIAKAASDLMGREPSALSNADKLLWDIGVAGRQATPAETADIISRFATGG